LKLINLIKRKSVPDPWKEGDNIPWNDPAFSKRMLSEHLNQDHNLASRKANLIDQHVCWINQTVLKMKPAKILDLGCGPGLYSSRLAKLGHQCFGIDYSPASIAYAKHSALEDTLACTYLEADMREADFGNDYDAVLLIFGEFNVFKPEDARQILNKAWLALKPGGHLLLEPSTYDSLYNWGNSKPFWYTSETGLFHETPYVVLEEYFWNPDQNVTTIRYYIIDAHNCYIEQHAQSVQAYTLKEYETLLEDCGYTNMNFYPSLMGEIDPEQNGLLAIMSEKQPE